MRCTGFSRRVVVFGGGSKRVVFFCILFFVILLLFFVILLLFFVILLLFFFVVPLVSKKAWLEWQGHQTMLINEKHLSLMDPEARKYLMGDMDKFLAGEDFDQAEGYVPPSE